MRLSFIVFFSFIFLFISGCYTPLQHPLRVSPGWYGEVSYNVMPMSGRTGACDNTNGCQDTENGGAMVNPLQLSGGYGWLLGGKVGVLTGATFPTVENQKVGAPGLVSGFGYFTWQKSPNLAVGAGPELGAGGIAGLAGVEWQPWPRHDWSPRLGSWARWFQPWELERRERNPRVPAWDLGVRLRFGGFYLQYAYYRQTEGIMYTTIYETAVYASAFHSITVGIQIDKSTLRSLDRLFAGRGGGSWSGIGLGLGLMRLR